MFTSLRKMPITLSLAMVGSRLMAAPLPDSISVDFFTPPTPHTQKLPAQKKASALEGGDLDAALTSFRQRKSTTNDLRVIADSLYELRLKKTATFNAIQHAPSLGKIEFQRKYGLPDHPLLRLKENARKDTVTNHVLPKELTPIDKVKARPLVLDFSARASHCMREAGNVKKVPSEVSTVLQTVEEDPRVQHFYSFEPFREEKGSLGKLSALAYIAEGEGDLLYCPLTYEGVALGSHAVKQLETLHPQLFRPLNTKEDYRSLVLNIIGNVSGSTRLPTPRVRVIRDHSVMNMLHQGMGADFQWSTDTINMANLPYFDSYLIGSHELGHAYVRIDEDWDQEFTGPQDRAGLCDLMREDIHALDIAESRLVDAAKRKVFSGDLYTDPEVITVLNHYFFDTDAPGGEAQLERAAILQANLEEAGAYLIQKIALFELAKGDPHIQELIETYRITSAFVAGVDELHIPGYLLAQELERKHGNPWAAAQEIMDCSRLTPSEAAKKYGRTIDRGVRFVQQFEASPSLSTYRPLTKGGLVEEVKGMVRALFASLDALYPRKK